jgi:hypothetical protein
MHRPGDVPRRRATGSSGRVSTQARVDRITFPRRVPAGGGRSGSRGDGEGDARAAAGVTPAAAAAAVAAAAASVSATGGFGGSTVWSPALPATSPRSARRPGNAQADDHRDGQQELDEQVEADEGGGGGGWREGRGGEGGRWGDDVDLERGLLLGEGGVEVGGRLQRIGSVGATSSCGDGSISGSLQEPSLGVHLGRSPGGAASWGAGAGSGSGSEHGPDAALSFPDSSGGTVAGAGAHFLSLRNIASPMRPKLTSRNRPQGGNVMDGYVEEDRDRGRNGDGGDRVDGVRDPSSRHRGSGDRGDIGRGDVRSDARGEGSGSGSGDGRLLDEGSGNGGPSLDDGRQLSATQRISGVRDGGGGGGGGGGGVLSLEGGRQLSATQPIRGAEDGGGGSSGGLSLDNSRQLSATRPISSGGRRRLTALLAQMPHGTILVPSHSSVPAGAAAPLACTYRSRGANAHLLIRT